MRQTEEQTSNGEAMPICCPAYADEPKICYSLITDLLKVVLGK